MSEAAPNRKSYDMTRYRKAIKAAWQTMRHQYAVYRVMLRYEAVQKLAVKLAFARDLQWWVLPDDVWPKIEEFELRKERAKEDRL